VKGRTRLHAEDAALLAKARVRQGWLRRCFRAHTCADTHTRAMPQVPSARGALPPPGAVKVPRQGPLLPGQQRTKLLKTTHE
jgi:hypothetical protein